MFGASEGGWVLRNGVVLKRVTLVNRWAILSPKLVLSFYCVAKIREIM